MFVDLQDARTAGLLQGLLDQVGGDTCFYALADGSGHTCGADAFPPNDFARFKVCSVHDVLLTAAASNPSGAGYGEVDAIGIDITDAAYGQGRFMAQACFRGSSPENSELILVHVRFRHLRNPVYAVGDAFQPVPGDQF